jgi:hypothetical protein
LAFQGLLEEDNDELICIADVSDLPVVHRWFARGELASMTRLPATDVPAHTAFRLSARDLADVVAYLTSRDGQMSAPRQAGGRRSSDSGPQQR